MAKKEVFVSVVVPCYNRAHYLKPTLDSILNQSYPHIECVVVDAASKDGTVEILESYGDRIKWISEPDKGHADAINKGWKMCRGDIWAWVNADDLWAVPNAVSIAVKYFEDHPYVDLVYGRCGNIDENGNKHGSSYVHDWDLEYAVEYCDHCIPQPTVFMRRSIIEKVGWLDTEFYQKKDHELWLRIGLAGKIVFLNELLGYARTQKGLSFEGTSVAKSCVQITKKFFTLDDIPDSLRKKEKRALSNSYLRGASYAWSGGKLFFIMLQFIFLAMLTDPSNIQRIVRKSIGK